MCSFVILVVDLGSVLPVRPQQQQDVYMNPTWDLHPPSCASPTWTEDFRGVGLQHSLLHGLSGSTAAGGIRGCWLVPEDGPSFFLCAASLLPWGQPCWFSKIWLCGVLSLRNFPVYCLLRPKEALPQTGKCVRNDCVMITWCLHPLKQALWASHVIWNVGQPNLRFEDLVLKRYMGG